MNFNLTPLPGTAETDHKGGNFWSFEDTFLWGIFLVCLLTGDSADSILDLWTYKKICRYKCIGKHLNKISKIIVRYYEEKKL